MGDVSSLRLFERPTLETFTQSEYDRSVTTILKYRQAENRFKDPKPLVTGAIKGNYERARLTHTYFSNCRIEGATYREAALTGAVFKDCEIASTDFSGASLQNTIFERCMITDCVFNGSDFSNAYLNSCRLHKCIISGGSLVSTRFDDCSVEESTIEHVGMEEACYHHTLLENMRMANLNMEYCVFDGITTKNMVFPFAQLPYVFNGLKYIFGTTDGARVSAIDQEGCETSISATEYRSLLDHLQIFYANNQDYFPLSNVLLAKGDQAQALSATMAGIVSAVDQEDFRMCKFFCRLIAQSGLFDSETLALLYRSLVEQVARIDLSDAGYYQYHLHLPSIRSLLLENPLSLPTATISFGTNIDDFGSPAMQLLLESFDKAAAYCPLPIVSKRVSFTKNSPIVGGPVFVSDIQSLLFLTVGLMMLLFATANKAAKLVERLVNIYTLIDERVVDHKRFELEQEQFKQYQERMAKEAVRFEERKADVGLLIDEPDVSITGLSKRQRDQISKCGGDHLLS